MDFFEVGVYVVMIIIASLCVFGVMWVLTKRMSGGKSRPARRSIPAQVSAGQAPKRLTTEKSVKVVEKRTRKAKEEGLMTLKDLPDSRLLPEARPEPEPKGPAERTEKTGEVKEVREVKEAKGTSSPTDKPVDVSDGKMDEAVLPELPSVDAPEDAENQSEAPPESVDLMSLFDTEEVDESGASDLAANLFDVDVANIERLSSEVSEYLNGMRSK